MSSFAAALLAASLCASPTSWVENAGFPYTAGPYFAVCGDEYGEPLTYSCEARAELHYYMALDVGREPDSAWEDTLARCERASL